MIEPPSKVELGRLSETHAGHLRLKLVFFFLPTSWKLCFLVLLELTTFVESKQFDNATLELVDLWLEFLSKFATL